MDNMFAGMGLGDFINKDKTTLVNSMIAGPDQRSESKVSIPSISKSSSNSNLSLQEKRKIMEQQEAAKSVKPPVAQTPADSLIAKSLSMNQMSSSASGSATTNWNSPSALTSWNTTSQGLGSQQPQQRPGAGFGNFSQAQSLIRPPAQKPDLSAFDNLLSPSSGGGSSNKQPMNSIGGKDLSDGGGFG